MEEGPGELTLRGRIEDSSVPELMRSVLTSGETGILTFRRADVTKSVYLHKGRVVYARSSNPDERLGEMLLLRGRITARQYLEASRQIRPGRRLGAVLVEMEALDGDELLPSVEQHVKEILLDVFTWSQGEYELVMSEPDSADVVTVNVSTEHLILEGIRRVRAWSQVYQGVGGLDAVLVQTGNTEVLYKLILTEEEQETLTRVNGRTTVEQICEVSYLPNFETCRILWAFLVLGIVRRGQAGESAPVEGQRAHEEELDLESVVERLNQALGRVYSFLRGRHGDDADVMVAAAQEQVAGRYEVLLYGVDLRAYGRADFDQMLANVADLPAKDRRALMIAGLKALLSAVQGQVMRRGDAEEAAVIAGIVKDGLRRIGAA
jgi:hypothetical protein